MVAHSALAHKLARATYHVLKEQTPFMPEKSVILMIGAVWI